MFQKKTIFIIPGYKHTPKTKAYKYIANAFKKNGFYTILIKIPWKQTTISENTHYFLKKYNKINRKNKYILGFSFGAMIAFIAATKVPVSGLILCSLSPYFKEDIDKIKKTNTSLMQRYRYLDFSQLDCESLVKKIKTRQILMLYGSRETRILINRVNEVFDQISSTQKFLFPINKTEHNIGDKRYLNKIHQIAKVLN